MTGLPEGSIRLYDEVDPGLDAGLYRVRAAVEIKERTSSALVAPAPAEEQAFVEVTAPRFSVTPDEVAACHPPPGASGAFATRLPHVVLGRRSLPWERRLGGVTPWIALLVFRKDEARLTGPLPLRTAVGNTVFGRLHALTPIAGDGPPVTVVSFADANTLRRILPSRDDVALLCHARQVSLGDSALSMGDDDGWFAIVTANRLPLAPTGPTGYVAALVSLEAREDLWTATPETAPLVVLHRWEFTSASGGTFEYLAANLEVGLHGAPGSLGEGVPAEDGSLALERIDRQGVRGPARYRGPLCPDPEGLMAPLPQGPGHVSADTAYELGRLLGAADGRFTREIVAWHRAVDTAAVASASLRETAAALAPAAEDGARAALATGEASPAPATLTEITKRLREMAKGSRRAADPWGVPPAARASGLRTRRGGTRPAGPGGGGGGGGAGGAKGGSHG
ncbi:MAG TPA: hypothetical protein VK539_06000 [Myxococcaceae bacterium]|nr:hypothetical protein [Myxococcaceae bacterium]